MNKITIFFASLLLLTSYGLSQQKIETDDLFVIEENGKYGYIDRRGEVIIPPQYDEASTFSDGLAKVRINVESPIGLSGICGFINKTGEWVIEPQYNDASSVFSEGLAWVMINGKYGYIDKRGTIIIKPQFDGAFNFAEGLAWVNIGGYRNTPGDIFGGKFGYIDKSGKFIINPNFDFANDFSEGLACVGINHEGFDTKYGYIEKTGEWVIEPQYKDASTFSEGLAAVKIDKKHGFIDRYGRIIIKPKFDYTWNFCEGFAAVMINAENKEASNEIWWKTGSKWGYIDKNGNYTIPPQFEVINNFSEGLAAVSLSNQETGEKYGYINKTGKYIINPQFNDAYRFYKGLALVNFNSNWGYIDTTGKFIWKSAGETSISPFDFTLEQMGGGKITLSEQKGKVVLVDFWATWCPPCRAAIPHLVRMYDAYKDQGLIVLGISLDQQKEVLPAFVTEYKITYPILLGNQELAKAYEVQSIPTLVIFDKKGKIAFREVGFNEENVTTLENKVLELLQQ